MRVLAHPLRLGPDGHLVTVAQGSDAERAQQLALLIGTRPGEAPLTPTLGLPDPRYDQPNPVELEVQAAVYLPDVTVLDVTRAVVSDTEQTLTVDWQTTPEDQA